MKFTYIYRKSDGSRQEGIIEAESRDDAFAELRKRKIRPVKMISESGSKANGEERVVTNKRFAFVALCMGLIIGIVISVWAVRRDWRDCRLVELEQKAQKMLAHNEYVLGTLKLDELRDYQQIQLGKGTKLADQKITLANCTLDEARREVRNLFCTNIEVFADNKDLKSAVEKLYSIAMDAVDRHQGRIAREERAYYLLIKNIGKWHEKNGEPVFEDEALNVLYGDLTKSLTSSKKR